MLSFNGEIKIMTSNSPNKTLQGSLVNLFEKFDKRRKSINHDNNQTPVTSTYSDTSPSSSKSTTLFNNLNFNFNNKLKSVNQNPALSSNSNIVVIDDNEYDDPSESFGSASSEVVTKKLKASSSLCKIDSNGVGDRTDILRQRFAGKLKPSPSTSLEQNSKEVGALKTSQSDVDIQVSRAILIKEIYLLITKIN